MGEMFRPGEMRRMRHLRSLCTERDFEGKVCHPMPVAIGAGRIAMHPCVPRVPRPDPRATALVRRKVLEPERDVAWRGGWLGGGWG